MNRLTIIAALFLLVVSADLEGTYRMNRDNRRCQSIGRQAERDGIISEREARRIARWECKKSGDQWVSARFYSA